jgi:hypothetical protein
MSTAHDLDFWLGDWDISWGEGLTASNQVARILDGAVIREDFDGRPGADFRGSSWSVYSPQLDRWRQTWVDSLGSFWSFIGGLEGEHFILVTDDVRDGQPVKLRMVFYHIAADSLDWDWERSDDQGASWKLLWQLHYQRRPKL